MSLTSNQFKSSTIRGTLNNIDDTVNGITASVNIQRDVVVGGQLTVNGVNFTSKVNTSDYGTFNGDVILNQSNTYLSGDTTNFTIKNKYSIYTPVYSVNPLVVDTNLKYFYTFNNSDLQNGYLKNQANNQYDLQIISGSVNDVFNGTSLNSSIIQNSSFTSSGNYSIGCWFISTNTAIGQILFLLSSDNTYTNGISMYIASGTIFVRDGGTTSLNGNNNIIQSVNSNTWYHIVYVNSGGTIWYVYINGI